jgi:CRISPR-associated protein Cas2
MTATALYVVCYDIVCDRLRAQAAKRMLDYGTRIQDSVYECNLDKAGVTRLKRQIEQFPLGEEDKVRLYRVCGDCMEQIVIYGKGEVTEDPEFWLV